LLPKWLRVWTFVRCSAIVVLTASVEREIEKGFKMRKVIAAMAVTASVLVAFGVTVASAGAASASTAPTTTTTFPGGGGSSGGGGASGGW
jgi:uncharacterized membrane protein YgcG